MTGHSPSGGTGVFATRFIPRGTEVIHCGGRRLPTAAVSDDMRSMQVHVDRYLVEDPRRPRIDDYINHGCSPNLAFWRGSLTLYALRNIVKGEEIRFDYSTCMNETDWWLRCRCGARNCRRVVTGFSSLSLSDQRRLRPLALRYLRR